MNQSRIKGSRRGNRGRLKRRRVPRCGKVLELFHRDEISFRVIVISAKPNAESEYLEQQRRSPESERTEVFVAPCDTVIASLSILMLAAARVPFIQPPSLLVH